jgi:putative ABC transport system substrate-binding protein
MLRRNFIALAGGAIAYPLAGRAQPRVQPSRIPRIGVLWHAANAEEEDVYLRILSKAFSDLGYIEGKSIELEHRFPAEQPERFRSLALELAESKVDVIVAVTSLGAAMARKATRTIPVVFVIVADPVGEGLVESLARPGGNLTGLSIMSPDLSGKRFGLLKEAVPNLTRAALMLDPRETFAARMIAAYGNAAKGLDLSLRVVEITSPDDIEPAFSTIAQDGFEAAMVAGAMMFNERARVGAAALKHKMPTLAIVGEMVPHGLLMSYGQDFPDYFRKGRRLRRQDIKRGQSRRSAGRTTHTIQIHHQSEDRKIPQSHDPAATACDRRRGDRVR